MTDVPSLQLLDRHSSIIMFSWILLKLVPFFGVDSGRKTEDAIISAMMVMFCHKLFDENSIAYSSTTARDIRMMRIINPLSSTFINATLPIPRTFTFDNKRDIYNKYPKPVRPKNNITSNFQDPGVRVVRNQQNVSVAFFSFTECLACNMQIEWDLHEWDARNIEKWIND